MAGPQSIWLGAVLLVGCGFEATPIEEEMEMDPPGMGSGTIVPPTERKCSTSDASLRLCIDFEDTATLAGDGSGRGHHPALAAGLTTMDRDAELAVQMASTSRLQIAEHVDLDIPTNLTISMWMKNDVPPPSGAYWMLDNNNQYAMSLQSNGELRCGIGSDTVDSLVPVGSSWHHVACTYDGNKLKVFIDGHVAGCKTISRTISTSGTDGLAIGANLGAGQTFSNNYVGGLDNVQVFARTWSDAELCAANGPDWCNSLCVPPYAGGNGDND